MKPATDTLCSMPTGDTPTKSWLLHPLEWSFDYFVPTRATYHHITTESLSEDKVRWRCCSKKMVSGILLSVLIIGSAGLGWYFNQRAGRGEFPSLYKADIEAVKKGLERNHFTSVDLVKASC